MAYSQIKIDADVTWEVDPSVEVQTVIGKTNSGFPIPTRQELGVDIPVLTPDGAGSQLDVGPAGSLDAAPEGEH